MKKCISLFWIGVVTTSCFLSTINVSDLNAQKSQSEPKDGLSSVAQAESVTALSQSELAAEILANRGSTPLRSIALWQRANSLRTAQIMAGGAVSLETRPDLNIAPNELVFSDDGSPRVPVPRCSLAIRSGGGGLAKYKPFTYCGALGVFPSSVNSAGLIAGNAVYDISGTLKFKAFTAESGAEGNVTNFRSLKRGSWEMTFAWGVANDGRIVGAACAPDKCNCFDPYVSNPSDPTSNCKLQAITWATITAQPENLPDAEGDQYPKHTEASGIADNGTRIVGTALIKPGPLESSAVFWKKVEGSFNHNPKKIGKGIPNLATGIECNDNFICREYRGAAIAADGNIVAFNYRRKTNGVGTGYTWGTARTVLSTCEDTNCAAVAAPSLYDGSPALDNAKNYPLILGKGMSPEGNFIVGRGVDQDASYHLPDASPRPELFLLPEFEFDTLQPFRMRALRWRHTLGTTTNLGDFPVGHYRSPPALAFTEYQANDSAYSGSRVVGEGYANGDALGEDPQDLSDKFRTAFVYPGLGGGGIKNLKKNLMEVYDLDVDQYNNGWKYQLIEASSLSPSGDIIIGSAICNGLVNELAYGYVVRVPPPD